MKHMQDDAVFEGDHRQVCNCLVPELEGVGNHSPSCAIFPLHGERCTALVSYPDQMVECGEVAQEVWIVDGKRRAVCRVHDANLEREALAKLDRRNVDG